MVINKGTNDLIIKENKSNLPMVVNKGITDLIET